MTLAEESYILKVSTDIAGIVKDLIRQRSGDKPYIKKFIDHDRRTVTFWAYYSVVDNYGATALHSYSSTVTYEYLLGTANPGNTAYYVCDMLYPKIAISP